MDEPFLVLFLTRPTDHGLNNFNFQLAPKTIDFNNMVFAFFMDTYLLFFPL